MGFLDLRCGSGSPGKIATQQQPPLSANVRGRLSRRLPDAPGGRLPFLWPKALLSRVYHPMAVVNLELTMAQPGSRPANDGSTWPYPSFDDRQRWLERPDSPRTKGVRHGLLAAIDAYLADDRWEVPNKTEEQRLLTAIWALTQMVEEAEVELSLLVAEARHKGVTWATIAAWLDVTRQAVHKRFASSARGW
jgi:hypothetical protein